MNFKQVIEKYGYPVVSKEIAQTIYEVKGKPPTKQPLYRMKKLNGECVSADGKKSRYNCSKWKFLLDAPFSISHKCCDIMKKLPIKIFERRTGKKCILGNMADESQLRKSDWIKHGCNAFDKKRQVSSPMGFWVEQDILRRFFLLLSNTPN